jgi:hypothetical protein
MTVPLYHDRDSYVITYSLAADHDRFPQVAEPLRLLFPVATDYGTHLAAVYASPA